MNQSHVHKNGLPLYVHYGCHHQAPAEWINFDASPTLQWEQLPVVGRLYTTNSERFPANVRYGDIAKGLPLPDRSCRGAYASHVLEHLSLEDFHRALDNTKRLLAEDGIFRLVVPDLEWSARKYLANVQSGDGSANEVFLSETHLGRKRRPRGLRDFLHGWLGNSMHCWMWDEVSLRQALLDHGFKNVRRCQFGDSEDRMFRLVERQDRFENAVAMECRV